MEHFVSLVDGIICAVNGISGMGLAALALLVAIGVVWKKGKAE
jgi:hypothetical protein